MTLEQHVPGRSPEWVGLQAVHAWVSVCIWRAFKHFTHVTHMDPSARASRSHHKPPIWWTAPFSNELEEVFLEVVAVACQPGCVKAIHCHYKFSSAYGNLYPSNRILAVSLSPSLLSNMYRGLRPDAEQESMIAGCRSCTGNYGHLSSYWAPVVQ